jgi:hypothetical protein
MASQAKETRVNPIVVATVASVGTVAKVGQTGFGDEEAEPEESSSDVSIDPALDESEWAAELSRRQQAFKHLKRYHKHKSLPRRGMTKAEMNAEVKRALDEDAKRQALFKQQMMFQGVGIGYFEDENGKLIKRKPPRKRSVRRSAPSSASVPRKARVRASRPMTEEDRERISSTRDQRHTRFWYAQQLAAFIDGKLKLSREQYHALLSFARMRGWDKKYRPGK